jgi:PPK2 family polyphosphate:nucleotide phosphotransferase
MEEYEEEVEELLKRFRVDHHESFKLEDYPTHWEGTQHMQKLSSTGIKKNIKKYLKYNLESLKEAQELLWASNRISLLIILQAMDAAGKDSTIEHVMSGVNPQGVTVHSFKRPSKEELDHNFLWRYWKRMPERGKIGIFNRSYYEEVLIVKVHPEILESRPLPEGIRDAEFWNNRYKDINAMEEHLCRSGTVILKFFLNVSKEEQKNRFLKRLNNPDKHWKFSESDLNERQYWDKYMQCFEENINATSTKWAPWHVIPADDKWKMRALVSMIITEKIQSLDLSYPEVDDEKRKRLAIAREHLNAE